MFDNQNKKTTFARIIEVIPYDSNTRTTASMECHYC